MLLIDIISRIISSQNSKSAWNELLLFTPANLSKPKRGGAKRNLSNLINKRTAKRDKDHPWDSLPTITTTNNARKINDEDQLLVSAMRAKLEAGNFKAALRILCSDDAPAPPNDATLQVLKDKHPGPTVDRRAPIDPTGNLRYTPLQISPDDVRKSLLTSSLGSSGGPDGLTPQHLIDLLAGDSDSGLLNALTDLINFMLAGKFYSEINTIIYGGWLIALSKKDDEVRPIAVEYVLRWLAAKCPNSHVIEDRS